MRSSLFNIKTKNGLRGGGRGRREFGEHPEHHLHKKNPTYRGEKCCSGRQHSGAKGVTIER